MEANPNSADSQPAVGPMPPRKPWLAALLALAFGFVSMVYLGRFRRGLAWVLITWSFALVGCAAILYVVDGPVMFALAAALMVVPHFAIAVDAVRIAKRSAGLPRRPYQRWWVYLLLIVGVGFAGDFASRFIRQYWAEAFIVPTNGMRPTIMAGDRIWVDKLVLRQRAPRHGDVVAFFVDGPKSSIFVDRVIGLPGDVVEVRNEQVFRNGEALAEHYAIREGELHPAAPQLANMRALTVGPDEIVLLGDNRRTSKDSRFDGPYALADVIGVARVIFWSREYSWKEAPDQFLNPEGEVTWGSLRWSRFGRRLD